MGKISSIAAVCLLCFACSSSGDQVTSTLPNGGGNTGGSDGGTTPPATDGGTTTPPDDGGVTTPPATDGGVTTPPADGGVTTPPADGGTTTGMTPGSLGPGPWPMNNVEYGSAQGILETPVVGVTTDESQNLWVATQQALYLMRPGETKFTRFDANAGLHLPGTSEASCYDRNGLVDPCTDAQMQKTGAASISYSSASNPGISEIVGGGPNEVFVGYWGEHDWSSGNVNDSPEDPGLPNGTPIDGTREDALRHTGQLDHVALKPDGSIAVNRYQMVASTNVEYWHNRDVERMIYDHFTHRHELYVGTNHGVDKITPDLWHEPQGWWLSDANQGQWMSDHLHPRVCLHAACPTVGEGTEMIGDWRGLALDAKGDLWVGGRWAAGKIRYLADNTKWWLTGGSAGEAINPAFGDPYTGCGNPGSVPPIFCPPQEGDPVNISATTVTSDGAIWWASGTFYHDPSDVPYGVASYVGHTLTYYTPAQIGLGEADIRDMVALPDGRLVIAGLSTGLTFWNPATGEHTSMHAGNGIPSDTIYRLELDTMVDPPALHVATAGGAAVIRVMP